ncbi:hypothetical protein M0R45_009857 [Rubus argutus]|uniref:Uncharacterized protein n=1 Tax=Rubus argutus TaxID=59490 RepID=A0AAW1Y634_RUBAR
MEHTQREVTLEEKEEEHAKVEGWKYVLGFSKIAVVKCAIELGIADAIENHGSPMTLLDLSSTLKCDLSSLYRIMSPVMLASWHGLSSRVQGNGTSTPSFEAVHGEDIWSFSAANPGHSKLINEAMACDARMSLPAVIESCLEVFNGIETIVDVGGG